jgi:hypothetical protein
MNIQDYIIEYYIPDDSYYELKELIESQSNWSPHLWYGPEGYSEGADDCLVSSISIDQIPHTLEFIRNSLLSYFSSISVNPVPCGLSLPRLNRYYPGTKMAKHFDSIKDIFDGIRKGNALISALALVKSAIKGGEFYFYFGNEKVEYLKKERTLILFPSTFVYTHSVELVEEGVRDSFIIWAY